MVDNKTIVPPPNTTVAPMTPAALVPSDSTADLSVLLHKLLKIGGEIGHVAKDAYNPHHKYKYASEKEIKEAVYPKFRQHGVFFSLEVDGLPFEMGNSLMVPFRYRFIDADTGAEFYGGWLGSGRLGDDKGLYIAITGAIKYALTTHCGIVTGDDPEAEDDGPTERRTIPAQDGVSVAGHGYRCANCDALTDNVRPMPSKYETAKFGVKIGDPVYRCDNCGKWVPVRETVAAQ